MESDSEQGSAEMARATGTVTVDAMYVKNRLRNIHTGSAKIHLGSSSFSEWLVCTCHSGA